LPAEQQLVSDFLNGAILEPRTAAAGKPASREGSPGRSFFSVALP
jgi:hypothetical protein